MPSTEGPCCRLLYVVGQLGLGGQERQLCYLLRVLDRAYYQPAVVVWNSSQADVYVHEISKLGVPIYTFSEGISRPEKLWRFRKLVKRLDPELLHSYSFFTNFPAWFATIGTKIIPIGSIRNNFLNDRRLAGRVFGLLSAGWPDRQICNSMAAQQAAALARWPFKPRRLQLVRNGIDVDEFSLGLSPSNKQPLLAIGRLYPEKRWDRLISAVGLLAAQGISLHLRFAGDGPLLQTLHSHAKHVGVAHLIEFLGPRRDIKELLAESRFLVHTAAEEGCPNVVMEAMACGRPVVAMDAGDVPYLVENGRTGFVVRQDDEAALADRMRLLLNDDDLCLNMGQAARTKAEQEFSLDRLMNQTLHTYRAAGWSDARMQRGPEEQWSQETGDRGAGRVRVLAVTNMYPASSSPHAGRFVQEQIDGLRRAGVDVEVLFIDRLRHGMRVYADLPRLLSKAVTEYEPDLVHSMYGGIMARLVVQVVKDRPVVVSFHGSDLLGQSFERPSRRLFAACGVLASKQAAKRCSGVVLVAEHLRRSLPAARRHSFVQVIPCGIDLNLFKPLERDRCCEKLGWKRGKFHILFQNTGDPVKRPRLAYSALDCLKNKLNVDAEIHELRGVRYDQVPVWLGASDVLLVTSFHEGSPTIVKEALACNLPIVSVAVGDIPQRIDGIDGSYLSEPTPDDLADKLQMVRINAKRIEAGSAIEALSVDHAARQLSRFYQDVIHARGTTQAVLGVQSQNDGR